MQLTVIDGLSNDTCIMIYIYMYMYIYIYTHTHTTPRVCHKKGNTTMENLQANSGTCILLS